MAQEIQISNVIFEDRQRQDLGDIQKLADSISEFGLLQPIVLTIVSTSPDEATCEYRLVAGGRRFTALKKLGWTTLIHGEHFVWLQEHNNNAVRRKAVELEENLRRKDLTWQEQVTAKQKLLDLMKSIHGDGSMPGGPTRGERFGVAERGFSINKLAAMLEESVGQTHKDLTVAKFMNVVPGIAKAQTKESAFRQLKALNSIASMVATAAAKAKAAVAGVSSGAPAAPPKDWTLYEGDFRLNAHQVPDGSVDLVYTDLPFGVSLDAMSKHDRGVLSYTDDRSAILGALDDIARDTYRVLAPDRFAIFWFGFNYYPELVEALERAGLNVNRVPFVWYKHTRSTENPNARYANAYDPAIICSKGSAVFLRPGQTNLIDLPALPAGQKLQIAQQPEELVRKFLSEMVVPGATVLDWTAGSGTTGVAAVKFGCRAVMFERDGPACALIRARMGAI